MHYADSDLTMLLFVVAAFLFGRMYERSVRTEKRTDRLEEKVDRLSEGVGQQGKQLGVLECVTAQLAVQQRSMQAKLSQCRKFIAGKIIEGDQAKLMREKGRTVVRVERAKGMVRVAGAVALAALGAGLAYFGVPVPQSWRWGA